MLKQTNKLSEGLKMAELFETTPQNITMHIRNMYKEGELEVGSTVRISYKFERKGIEQ